MRAIDALRAVLPGTVELSEVAMGPGGAEVMLAGGKLCVAWAGEGWVGDVRPFARGTSTVDVVAARRMSPGARAALDEAGVGWVDELGNAEISTGSLVVSRTGRAESTPVAPARWTPAFVSVAEAILSGATPTVAATVAATGLSTGTCTNALKLLTDLELLESNAERGRTSGRCVADRDVLLHAYAEAATALASPIQVSVGVTWRDPVQGLIDLAPRLAEHGTTWAATGVAAAAVMAPLLTNVGSAVIYVDAATAPALEMVARSAGLKPIEGGRLVLRPAPIGWTPKTMSLVDGLQVAPWSRVYVDLRNLGVRGEKAADHLAEVFNER